MSDNYKVLRNAREFMLNMQSDKGSSVTDLVKETGLAHQLVKDILETDPVSIKVREATMIKLRTFLEKQSLNGHTKIEPIKTSTVIKGDTSAFSVIEVPESMADAIPAETEIERDPHGTENLLNELSELANRFQKQGYRLRIKIDLINTF